MRARHGLGWVWVVAALGAAACDDAGADGAVTADTASAADAVAGDAVADTSGSADTAAAQDTVAPVTCDEPTGARPSARAEHAGIYDPVGHRLVIFGGSLGVPVNCGFPQHTYESETWIYDIACEQWRAASPAQAPVGRVRHAAVYDSARHRMIVYGGRERTGSSGPYTLHPEVLAFDLTTETWTEIAATTSTPPARFNHAMAYDPAGDRLVVMGGNTSSDPLNYEEQRDVWTFDFATAAWSQVSTAAGATPAKRFWHAGLWDAARGWFVIFGGADNASAFNPSAAYFSDAWALDFTQQPPIWYQLDTGGQGPIGRFWGGFVHDTLSDRYLLFGGHDDQGLGNRNDLWELAPLAGTWARLGEGDTPNAGANGQCDFPPDFANVAPSFPERRHAGVTVAGAGAMWVVGGKTDCGNVDDLFSYDMATGGWTEVVTATVGEVCLRKGGVNCNDLCF